METVLYNTILGAKPIQPDGVSFYYADYNNSGASKFYYDQKWPCCSGTFPQLTADYGISSYFRSAKGIHVNLYVPSRISWQQGGTRVALTQQTQYPANGDSSMQFAMPRPERFTVALRIPAWAGRQTKATVNGKSIETQLTPGNWAEIDRTWKDGDRIELTLDMPLRLAPIDEQHPHIVALLAGPVALFAIEQGAENITQKQLLAAQRAGSSGAWEVTTATKKIRMLPYRFYQGRAISPVPANIRRSLADLDLDGLISVTTELKSFALRT